MNKQHTDIRNNTYMNKQQHTAIRNNTKINKQQHTASRNNTDTPCPKCILEGLNQEWATCGLNASFRSLNATSRINL